MTTKQTTSSAASSSTKTAKSAKTGKISRARGDLIAVKRQLRRTRPVFKRHAAHRKAELSERWKKPRGLHNKLKDSKRGCGPAVTDGYRTPQAVRGLHVSGLRVAHVATTSDLVSLDPKTTGVVVASVGAKRQLEILNACEKAGIRVLNHKADARAKELTERFTKSKEARENAREQKKTAESKKAKDAKKAPVADETPEEHKTSEEKAKKEVLTSKNQ
jgi:large subunit ribosomal protein L32e